MNYLLILVSTILLAFDFSLSRRYQSAEGVSLAAGLRFNCLNGLFTAIIFFCISGFRITFSWLSVILAFSMALFALTYSVLGFRILKTGNMATYSLFLMSGGMLLPYLYGVLFLDEMLNLFRIGGMLLILAAVILSNLSKIRFSPRFSLLCFAVFLLNGFVSIFSKSHQVAVEYPTVSTAAFVMYSGIGKCLLSGAALLTQKQRISRPAFSGKRTPLLIVSSALIGGISYLLQLIGAKDLPATVLYPLVTGGSIVFSALCGKLLYKEQITRIQWICIVLCVAGTLMFL